jgi:hypothetical protein
MDQALMETEAGEGGGVSQPMARHEEGSTAMVSMRALPGGWNDGVYQLPGGNDAFSVTTVLCAD